MTWPPELYLVRCKGNETLAIGERQAAWLEKNGHIERLSDPHQPYAWLSTPPRTLDELDELVFAQRELRECDFCQQPAGGWLVHHRPTQLTTLGPTGGRKEKVRPFICCDRCIRYVHDEDPAGLAQRGFDRIYARAHRMAMEAEAPIADKELAATVLVPQLRGVVDAMFASKTFAEEDTD